MGGWIPLEIADDVLQALDSLFWSTLIILAI